MPPVVASLGELLVEFVCTETDGHNLRAAPYVGPFPSGAPGIFIDQAARMGARAVFAGAVGDDAFGRVLRDRLAASGVSDALIRVVPGVPTGTAHVAYNSDGSREFVFNLAHSAAALVPPAATVANGFRAAGTQVLHVSGSSLGDPGMRAWVLEVCEATRDGGAAISIDPNIRTELMTDAGYLGVVRRIMAMADYILPSDADAALLFPGAAFDDWSQALIASGARVVALKRGAGGVVARDGGQSVDLAGHAVSVVDPTGAGDCFCATFVSELAGGASLRTALETANAAGALSVQKLGPMEGNSDRQQIAAFLAGQA